jgi:hypothetical protein
MLNVENVIQENKKRNADLDSFYDPLKGIGSPLERFRFYYPDAGIDVNLPTSMRYDKITSHILQYKTFSQAASAYGIPEHELFEQFVRERFKHDFEFWAATCITILHKDLFKPFKFRLRKVQRKLLLELELMRLAGVPIRIVLLKARQWGGSTLVQMYMFWIQQIHRENWHMAIVAQDDNAAKNISSMYQTAAENYPSDIASITFKSFNRSSKNIKSVERKGIIGVGSFNNPDQFRSYNYAMVHLSEVGIWQDTTKRTAANLIASLKETVPDQPYTVVVEESTAKGLNYFYESWKKAVSGKTRYKAVFIAWCEIDRCRVSLDIPVEEFLKSFSDYDLYLWKLGATLEGINWYRKHQADKQYQDWEMQGENPSTPEEAFQSTGQKIYPPAYVLATRRYCKPPLLIGDVFGKTRLGEFALNDLRIEKITNGNLKVWLLPDEVKSLQVKNRFCAFGDIGGTTSKADYSCLKLIDRLPMLYGNFPKVAAMWHGHLDQDLFAWKMAQLCYMYSDPEIDEYPLLAFELQSLKKEKVEGSHALTVLDNIKDHYPNLFIRNDIEKVGDGFIPKYGWASTHAEKGRIIDAHKATMRENLLYETDEHQHWGYEEMDEGSCDEFSWYETKPDGSMGAVAGKKDDKTIISAGSVWLATVKMDLPFIIQKRPMTVKKIRNYTSY